MARPVRFSRLFAVVVLVGLLVPAFRSSCGRLGVPMPCCAKEPGKTVPPCCAVDRAPDPVDAAHERVQVAAPHLAGTISATAAFTLPQSPRLDRHRAIVAGQDLAPPRALPLRV